MIILNFVIIINKVWKKSSTIAIFSQTSLIYRRLSLSFIVVFKIINQFVFWEFFRQRKGLLYRKRCCSGCLKSLMSIVSVRNFPEIYMNIRH